MIGIMKIADYILEKLADAGIDTCFTVYGGAMSELLDAFTRQHKIKYVCPHHEQAASFMAEGYAKAKGVPGFCLVTSGPGAGNIITGIQNCYYDSTPVIFITGQVNSNFLRPSDKIRQLGFQETPIVEMVKPITKYAAQCLSVDEVKANLRTALCLCKNGRPGPVLLDIPTNIQKAEVKL